MFTNYHMQAISFFFPFGGAFGIAWSTHAISVFSSLKSQGSLALIKVNKLYNPHYFFFHLMRIRCHFLKGKMETINMQGVTPKTCLQLSFYQNNKASHQYATWDSLSFSLSSCATPTTTNINHQATFHQHSTSNVVLISLKLFS